MFIYLFITSVLAPIVILLLLATAINRIKNTKNFAIKLKNHIGIPVSIKYYEAIIILLGLPVMISPVIFITIIFTIIFTDKFHIGKK